MIGELGIGWSPLLPLTLLAALSILAFLSLFLAWWCRAPGAGWRTVAFAVILLSLANPSLLRETRRDLDDVVLIVEDASASQNIGERPQQRASASAHLRQELDELPRVELRSIEAAPESIGLDNAGSRVFAAIERGLANVPRQRMGAVFIVTDGQIHDAPERLDSLGIEAPVHVLLTGEQEELDRRILVEDAPSFGIVGRKLSLNFKVEDLPATSSLGSALVTLRRDGREVQRLTVPVGLQQSIEVELDRRGTSVFELEVAPGPSELTTINNRAAVVINGVRERLRVLLVSGEPHPGERAWRNILKSDPSVDLVHFTILRPPEKQDGTPIRELSLIAFPTRELFEVKLEEFDLIIFDRYRRRGVLPSLYFDNIARYVDQGGALLEASGPSFATPFSIYRTPLGRVLPAEPSGEVRVEPFRPELTEIGRRHPVTATLSEAGAPGEEPRWGRWFRQIEGVADRGQVVMSGIERAPLLLLDRVGEGRVAQFLSDQIWLWSRGYDSGGPQADLVRRIAHWLMKEPDLEEEALLAEVDGNRLLVERRSLGEALPPIEVTTPSGRSLSLTLESIGGASATAEVQIEETGIYRLTDGERVTLTAAGPLNPLEFRDPRSSAEILAPLVEASGGRLLKLAEADLPDLRKVRPGRDSAGRGWLGIKENRSYVVTGISQTPLLPAGLFLILLLGATIAAWRREGR